MPSDITECTELLQQLGVEIAKFCGELHGFSIDWAALQWTTKGPASLFDQYTKAGSWSDFIESRLLAFELRKNAILVRFNDGKASLEVRQDAILRDHLTSWISRGMSQTERAMLAKIELGDSGYEQAAFERLLIVVDASLVVLKAKVRQLKDFRADAKAIAQIMNFGHVLGELR